MKKKKHLLAGLLAGVLLAGNGGQALAAEAVTATPPAQEEKVATALDEYRKLYADFNRLEGTRLVFGNFGPEVAVLQRALIYLGYRTSPTGYFGPVTKKALEDFQLDHSMKVTGVFDLKSFYAIRYALLVNPPRGQSRPKEPVNTANTLAAPAPAAQPAVNEKTAAPAAQPAVNEKTAATAPLPPGFTQKDLDLLARLVYSEARGEPFEGQVAVAAVALNRLKSPLFPNTLEGVIFEPWAFTAVIDGQFWLTPDATAYAAARAALNGWDPTGGALYYWNPVTATSKWVWSRTIIKQIGRHVFAV